MTTEKMLEPLLQYQQKMENDLLEIHKRSHQLATGMVHTGNITLEPIYDLYILDGILHMELELPGVVEEDIEVELAPKSLKITGKVHKMQLLPDEAYLVQNRKYGIFDYMFTIPSQQILSHETPELHHGILHLKLHLESAES
ncbi:MAG: Hsp20/alpha crystallin family protein [SAR324 cluster bacterium]|nr:Hsp20/alpha crystallin family protein [SAR324 cluster bacterium]